MVVVGKSNDRFNTGSCRARPCSATGTKNGSHLWHGPFSTCPHFFRADLNTSLPPFNSTCSSSRHLKFESRAQSHTSCALADQGQPKGAPARGVAKAIYQTHLDTRLSIATLLRFHCEALRDVMSVSRCRRAWYSSRFIKSASSSTSSTSFACSLTAFLHNHIHPPSTKTAFQ